eukprot:gb/GECH01013775.1/.p1 GENE.gb/GECH01013775.1/~~gb/GECH01013775.1/.p1  ORF type:complete len:259 (+),score=80.14 gb/GECH01013775.1/:1-777(+)
MAGKAASMDVPLNAQEEQKFEEFKSLVEKDDNLSQYKNDTLKLKRFLKARKFKTSDALEMLQKAEKWNQEYRPSEITAEDVKDQLDTNKAFIQGKDRRGRPILIVKPRYHNPNDQDPDHTIKMAIYLIEEAVREMDDEVCQMILIYDRVGFSKANYDIQVVKRFFQLSANFPERLAKVFIHQSNWFFTSIISMVKPFIDPGTASKIHILSNDNYAAELLEWIDENNLLVEFGGSARGPAGTYEESNNANDSNNKNSNN